MIPCASLVGAVGLEPTTFGSQNRTDDFQKFSVVGNLQRFRGSSSAGGFAHLARLTPLAGVPYPNLTRPPGLQTGRRGEFYDLVNDPLDQVDLASRHPDVADRLSAQLDYWRERAEAAQLPTDAEAAESPSAEDLERLKALGYIE